MKYQDKSIIQNSNDALFVFTLYIENSCILKMPNEITIVSSYKIHELIFVFSFMKKIKVQEQPTLYRHNGYPLVNQCQQPPYHRQHQRKIFHHVSLKLSLEMKTRKWSVIRNWKRWNLRRKNLFPSVTCGSGIYKRCVYKSLRTDF